MPGQKQTIWNREDPNDCAVSPVRNPVHDIHRPVMAPYAAISNGGLHQKYRECKKQKEVQEK